MALSDPFTLIPSDFWCQDVYGVDPYRFNQVQQADSQDCDPIWCRYPPGFGDQGRYHLRSLLDEALYKAEEAVGKILNAPVAPQWVSEEVDFLGDCADLVQTRRFHVIQFGQPAWTKVGEYAPAYAGDFGTVTVPAADYSGDLCELWMIAPGYPSTEYRPVYAIRPVRWTRPAAGTSVGRAHKAQFVDPALWATCAELADQAATYLTTVEVWRQYRGAGEAYPHAEIVYAMDPTCADLCEEETYSTCAAVQSVTSLGPASAYVWPATWQGGKWVASCPPSGYSYRKVRLYYQAGVRPNDFERSVCTPYDRRIADAVARLATAMLAHQPCACDAVAQMFKRDREILGSQSTPAEPYAFVNPLGHSWAAQNAFKVAASIHPNGLKMGGRL